MRVFLVDPAANRDIGFEAARNFMGTGAYIRARLVALELAAHKSDEAFAWHIAGDASRMCGDQDSARRYLERALTATSHPVPASMPSSRTILAWLRLSDQDIVGARKVAREAVAERPRDRWALVALGNAAMLAGEYAEAEHAYRAALRRAPDDADARAGLGATLLKARRPLATAARHLVRALELDENNVVANDALSIVRAGQNRVEEALYYRHRCSALLARRRGEGAA